MTSLKLVVDLSIESLNFFSSIVISLGCDSALKVLLELKRARRFIKKKKR